MEFTVESSYRYTPKKSPHWHEAVIVTHPHRGAQTPPRQRYYAGSKFSDSFTVTVCQWAAGPPMISDWTKIGTTVDL